MTSNFEQSKAALLVRVIEVAEGRPNQSALYALEREVEYSSHWGDTRDQLITIWNRLGNQDDWCAALLTPPLDFNLLIDSFDRGRISIDWERERAAWLAKGPDRMYGRTRPARFSHAFAAHMNLLFTLNPVAAVDFFADLPSGGLVWAGAAVTKPWQDIGTVETVVSSAGEAAANLAMAGLFDAIEAHCRKTVQDQQEDPFTICNDEHERAVADEVKRFAPSWLEVACRAAFSRCDAAAVVGPWLRYLLSLADGTSEQRNHHALLASLALAQLEQTLTCSTVPLDICRLDQVSAQCILARMFSRQTQGQGSGDLWHEWIDLLLDEDASLRNCGQYAWNFAATSLAGTGKPATEWLSSLARLQPLFRQYERSPSSRPTACNLFLPAAIVAVLQQDRGLWSKVFEQVRRYALVSCPLPSQHLDYQLPALVAKLYPKVFQTSAVSEDILSLLPTAEHREWTIAATTASHKTGSQEKAGEVHSDFINEGSGSHP